MLSRGAFALLVLVSSAVVHESTGLSFGLAPQDSQAVEAEVEAEEEESVKSLLERYGGATFNLTSVHGSEHESVYNYTKKPNVPVINFDMNIDHHFEVLLSLIHYFKGGDLPYQSGVPEHVKALWEKARKSGSEVYVNAEHTSTGARRDMLLNQMRDYNIKIGAHKDPDLWVIVTVYPTLRTLNLAAKRHWKDNKKMLLIAHRFELRATEESFKHFEADTSRLIGNTHIREFSNFSRWTNTMGLMPLSPRYLMPTYFPYNYTHRNGTSRIHNEGWIPQLCVHGTLARRSWQPLADALGAVPASCPLAVKIAGIGKFPHELDRHKSRIAMLHMNSDLDYQNFFQQCDYLLPLLGNNTNSEYFHTKLSSTAARSIGHKIPVIAPAQFGKIYPMVEGRFYDSTAEFTAAVRDVAQCMTPWGA